LKFENILDKLKDHRKSKKVIVLATGCFDILHKGHEIFLEKAKQEGDILVVGVECDKNVKFYKGDNRPVNPEDHRLKSIESLPMVDYAFLITAQPGGEYQEYIDLVKKIKPDVYAVTEGVNEETLERSKETLLVTGGKVKVVISRIKGLSSSSLINQIQQT